MAGTSQKRSEQRLHRDRRRSHRGCDAPPARLQIQKYWSIAKELFANDVARERAYVHRTYQVKAAVRAVTIALAGKNVSIELPTGTGKTLIACLAAVLWKHKRPDSRVLLVVPSRTLVVQHFDVARWVARMITVDRLTDEQSGDPGSLRSALLRSDLLITTPGILAGGLRRGVVGEDIVASFDFVIVDEFDQFIVLQEHEHTSARYAKHWQSMMSLLPKNTRYVVKSATLGLDAQPTTVPFRSKTQQRPQFIRKRLRPIAIRIPEHSYAAVIPCTSIKMVVAQDSNITALLGAVNVSKGMAHFRLEEAIGAVDYKDVERRAPQLCEGRFEHNVSLRSPSGVMRQIAMTIPLRQAFCAITKLMMMPQHILEDLTRDLGTESVSCYVKNSWNESIYLQDAQKLRDDRPDGRFHFLRGRKTDALIGIVAERARLNHRGVVFVRTVTLLEGIKPILVGTGLPLFELTGERADTERKIAVDSFRRSSNGLLLMTRTTGGRGLDLPFAHYAAFYSPKSDAVTMWQEMSRIRSTVTNPKDVYVMCYGDEELMKLKRMAQALQTQGRRVRCVMG